MITFKELNPKGHPLTDAQQSSLNVLLERMNVLRAAYAKPMYVTSGFRSVDEHKAIYEKKAKKAGLKVWRVPMGSKHLSGEAVDIADPNGELQSWVLNNRNLLEDNGLWCEAFGYTPNWVHFQIVAPASGNRFFVP